MLNTERITAFFPLDLLFTPLTITGVAQQFGDNDGGIALGKLIPAGVFYLGLGALGWWAQNNQAEHIERHVQEGVDAVIDSTWHERVTVSVAGRDISISGEAQDEAEKARFLSALNAVDGRRVVLDDLIVVPRADNVTEEELTAQK